MISRVSRVLAVACALLAAAPASAQLFPAGGGSSGAASMEADFSRQDCANDLGVKSNGTASTPNTSCHNPHGLIAIDPTRYGFAAALGGRPDANGSMYGINTGSGVCSGGGAAIGCVDAATDFISLFGQSEANVTLTFSGSVSATKNSQTFTYASAGGNTGDKFFCRDTTTPFAPASSSGTCTGGACAFAIPSGFEDAWIVRHNVAAAVCTAASQPVEGCTAIATGTVWRYYPVIVSDGNMCSTTTNTLTVWNGLPETFLAGDSLQPFTIDGTHQSSYGHAYLAQLIIGATWEEMFVPRVNMIPGGNLEGATGDGSDPNCVKGAASSSFSFTGGGTWVSATGTMNPTANHFSRGAVYGRACYGANAVASASYATTPSVAVSAGVDYTFVGLVWVPNAAAQLQVVDQGGTVIDPTSARTVIQAWGPRGGWDMDPLTYNATGMGAAPTLDFPTNGTNGWAPLVAKIKVPAGVTAIAIRIGRSGAASTIGVDEFYMYPSLFQNQRVNRIFPDGQQKWTLTGDSRDLSTTYGADATHPGTFGMLDWLLDGGSASRPLMHFPLLFPSFVDALGGRKIADEVALAAPYPNIKSKRPAYAVVALGLNDANAARSPALIESDVAVSRETISSYGAVPVWLLEAPWKGAVGNAGGAQVCSVSTSSPDYSGIANNCGAALAAMNKRILQNGVAW